MDAGELYNADFVLWTEQQAAALRKLGGASNSLDIERLAEEIESLGERDVREVESYVKLMLLHALKIASDPNGPEIPHWRCEILNFQQSAASALSPSMRQLIDIDKAWMDAASVFTASSSRASRPKLLVAAKLAGSPTYLDEVVSPDFGLDDFLDSCSTFLISHFVEPPHP